MSDEICGEPTADGSPCENPACRTDGKCWMHTQADEPADVGRDSKLNVERQEQIAQAVEQGKSLTSAARMAGVDRTTVYGWIDKGEAQDEGIYAEFYNRLTRAKGHGEEFYFNLALEMAKENGDHRFIASLMKQRYPDSWGDTETGVEADETVINIPDSVAEKWERDITTK